MPVLAEALGLVDGEAFASAPVRPRRPHHLIGDLVGLPLARICACADRASVEYGGRRLRQRRPRAEPLQPLQHHFLLLVFGGSTVTTSSDECFETSGSDAASILRM